MSEKPLVFISYASPDFELAKSIKSQIEAVLGEDRVDVFASTIDAGDTWFPTIQHALDRCEALVVLMTPASVDRRWVWFEIGYIWAKTKDAERHIYPLAISRAQEIPHPLSEHQGKFLDSREDVENFFKGLCAQFGFGVPENVNFDKLIEMVRNSPEYPRKENLSEKDIKAILLNYLKFDYKPKTPIRYAKLDKDQDLPDGVSAKYLKNVAKDNGFEVHEETESGISFSIFYNVDPSQWIMA